MTLYTDINPYCCAALGSRVADGSLPTGDVVMADVRDLDARLLCRYRHVHLFAGIGGIALGLAWAGWPVALSVVTFGFPCQDISAAGKGDGLSGARSALFWEGKRIVEILKPDRFIAENVGALESRGLDVVAAAMESIDGGGYHVEALRVGAWALGASHERERWWIVGFRRSDADAGGAGLRTVGVGEAWADGQPRRINEPERGSEGRTAAGRGGAEVLADAASDGREAGAGIVGNAVRPRVRWQDCQSVGSCQGWQPRAPGPWRRERDEWHYAGPPVLVYAGGAGLQERDAAAEPSRARHAAGRPDPTVERGWTVPVLPGFVQHEWELPRLYQRGVGDTVHGLPRRMAGTLNRSGVMALGNAVVPQVVAAVAVGVIGAGGFHA